MLDDRHLSSGSSADHSCKAVRTRWKIRSNALYPQASAEVMAITIIKEENRLLLLDLASEAYEIL